LIRDAILCTAISMTEIIRQWCIRIYHY